MWPFDYFRKRRERKEQERLLLQRERQEQERLLFQQEQERLLAQIKEARRKESARLEEERRKEAARLEEERRKEAARLEEERRKEAARQKEEEDRKKAARLKEERRKEAARLEEERRKEAARQKEEEDRKNINANPSLQNRSGVLVVATTRMAGNHVCVGAIDLSNDTSIRLLTEDGNHDTIWDSPYEIGGVYALSYKYAHKRPMPHDNEDVLVLSTPRLLAKHNTPTIAEYFRNASQSAINNPKLTKLFIASGRISDLFEGKLQFTNWRKGFIGENNISSHSTCFLLNCQTKFILEQDGNGKYFYRADDNSVVVPWVGLEDPDPVIPRGRIVRFSLAHWWSPGLGVPERCYLQLSAYY